ncbi:MAG: ABC transporter permease [Burkholderiaceae bacterium]
MTLINETAGVPDIPLAETAIALPPHDAFDDAGDRRDGPSTSVWRAAGKRLMRDRVGMVAMVVVGIYLLLVLASFIGLIASDWQVERGVSYASPTFLGNVENLEAGVAALDPAAKTKAPPVDILDVDPRAPRDKEWAERAARIQVASKHRTETLPFGADKWGRDVLKKAIKGAQVSIFVGLVAALVATLIGTLLGATAGYFRGWIDDALEWFYSIFTSIPYILLILAFAAVFRANAVLSHAGVLTIIAVLGLTGWTGIYRLVRAEYIKHRAREYVRAADAIGASNASRMFVHILPNASHVILVQLSLHVVSFIKAEVILSFLSLGVPIDMVSWGTMLAEAQSELVIGKWWQLAAAGAGMAVLVTAFSLFTDSLRDALDPKLG